jgi:GNAT superfamily N-acetyltransferase
MEIIRATIEHVDHIAPLFDKYRQFYKAASDLDGSARFIRERLEKNESVIFLALERDNALGFAQLYPVFASVQMKRLWILNDLYVESTARKQGVGRALMKHSEDFARETGARGLFLRTATDNFTAQKLYEDCGWVRDTQFYRYDRIVE